MTLKAFSETAPKHTFTYEFGDLEDAQIAGLALFGYMRGTYLVPAIKRRYKENGTLIAEYLEDNNLDINFKRICEVFKNSENPIDEEVEE